MTTGSELFGWGEPGARGGGQGATGGPDFVRNDRGDADDHWSHAEGEDCAACGVELSASDFVRRRHDGTWVHENCPPGARSRSGAVTEADGDAE